MPGKPAAPGEGGPGEAGPAASPARGPVTVGAPPDAPHWLRAIQQVTGYSWSTLLSARMATARWERDLGISLQKRERALRLLARHAPLEAETRERLLATPTVAGWRRLLQGAAPGEGAATGARGFSPSLLTEERVTEALLDAVVAKTGLARAQLHLDADLEADLGIDSVKQAQVLGHLRRTYAVEFKGGLRLKDFPTLRSWVGFILSAARGEAVRALPGAAATGGARAVLREQLEWMRESLPQQGPRPLAARWRTVTVGTGRLPAGFEAAWAQLSAEGTAEAEGVLLAVGEPGPGESVASCLWSALGHLRTCGEGVAALQVLAVGRGEREGAGESPLFAATSGALKSLAAEDGRVQVALLRLVPGLLEARPSDCAHAAAREWECGGGAEAALDGQLERHVRRALPAELSLLAEETWRWPERPRVLVTGGGRGIAAKVAVLLAERHRARLLLLGRSAEDTSEVQATLEAVRAAGGEGSYLQADIAHEGAAEQAVALAQGAWGGLDAVLHAAGVIEDAPLGQKEMDSFARVLSPKVTGTLRLLEAAAALPRFPEAWVGFSSISAWRGNDRQVDYAAANEAMAALLRGRAAPRGARVRVLDFGPWDEVGMAERSGLARVLREAGEGLVPVAEGTEAVLVELAYGPGTPVEATWMPGPAFPAHAEGERQDGLLHSVSRGARQLEGRCALSVERDAWLAEHSLFDDPVLPGSMGLELMVEAARALLPGYGWAGVRDFAIHGAVALMGVKGLELTVRASAALGERAGQRAVRCRLELPGGRTCYEATVLLSRGEWGWPEPTPPPPPGDAPTSSAAEVYRRIRLGPSFHLLQQVVVARAREGAPARGFGHTVPLQPARFFRPGQAVARFAGSPLLLEAGFQCAAWLGLEQASAVLVPRSFQTLRLHGALDASRPVLWTVEARGAGLFDLAAWQDGRALAEVQGYQTYDVTAISTWHAAGAVQAGEAR